MPVLVHKNKVVAHLLLVPACPLNPMTKGSQCTITLSIHSSVFNKAIKLGLGNCSSNPAGLYLKYIVSRFSSRTNMNEQKCTQSNRKVSRVWAASSRDMQCLQTLNCSQQSMGYQDNQWLQVQKFVKFCLLQFALIYIYNKFIIL